MRFNLHMRQSVRDQIADVADEMKAWEDKPRISAAEETLIRDLITFFPHTTQKQELLIGGVDGTGDYPALAYGDSFVYVSVAQGTMYEATAVTGLREIEVMPEPVFHLTWLPEEKTLRRTAFDQAFSHLAGRQLATVIEQSDFRQIKKSHSKKTVPVPQLVEQLIRPHASDSGNIAIQLRSTAEFGAALRLIEGSKQPNYVLVDTTFSLPSATLPTGSLFFEHLKRLCCVKARERDIAFFALSKSHGLPGMEYVEKLAREQDPDHVGEHWYFRLPVVGIDTWTLSLSEGRNLPPPGAVSYLVRFHKNTPVMRLDMDRAYWLEKVHEENAAATASNEQRIFTDLDYACHDQRSFGYPYPIKSAHDQVSLTKVERVALRKQIIDAAVEAGMKRSLFRDASMATGHA